MRYLALIIAVFLVAGCTQSPETGEDSNEISEPVPTSVCAQLCRSFSVFNESRSDVPYNEDRKLKTVLRSYYINKLESESIVLSSCGGNAPENLECVFVGDDIAYSISNGVCHRYDTLIIPKLDYKTELILDYNFMKSAGKIGDTYSSPRVSSGSNWNVTVGEYIQIDIEWICD